MTKAEVVNEITKRTGVEKKLVLDIVDNFMGVVKDALHEKENVYLRGFGSFIIKQRASKTARNISKNVTIQIPARKIPSFKPSKTFTEMIEEK